MSKKVLMLASNVGLWAEELQAPWDALRKAGHQVTLATHTGKTPLPLALSMDPNFIDPVQKRPVNTVEGVERAKKILADGEWDNPIKTSDAKIADYDVLAMVGGPGSPLDLVGDAKVHRMLEEAYRTDKIIGALCYSVGALVWARNPDNDGRSIIYGKTITAHPREWDFIEDMSYELYGATADNPSTNLITPGFVYPLAVIVEDAVGPAGRVLSDPTTSREKPLASFDYPFVTALSTESSIAYGQKLVEVLETEPTSARHFYTRHVGYFRDGNIDAVLENDYTDDAVLTAPDFTVKGRDAIRQALTAYVGMLGKIVVKTTDTFIESGNGVFIEATCQTEKGGERKVFDIFIMRDGKIAQHFTGVK